jgi:integrase
MHQEGYIWRKGRSWYGRWRDDVYENGQVVRKQRSAKLAEYSDRYRTERDVRPLLEAKLRPINARCASPESTHTVEKYVEDFYLPYAEENLKPSTCAQYKTLWQIYVKKRSECTKIALRDFRTVDAANLLSGIHREHLVGRSLCKHIKSLLSGVFTYAKNQGVLDGVNPIRDAMIPKKATPPQETHAATPDEVLAILEALKTAKPPEYRLKAQAAIALQFFAGLRPGEARGVHWEDFDGKRLVIRQSVWHTYTTSPKTESSIKPVPVIEPLASILAELRTQDGNPASGPILRGPSGKPLDLHNLANRVVIPACKKAEIAWHGWYSLRRGVGTAVTALSKDSLAAKGLLRHSSVSTTERHYIKDVPESTLQAMKQLEALCNQCATERGSKPN